MTYEKQPLGLTTLFLLDSPESGGDTIFAEYVLPSVDLRAPSLYIDIHFSVYFATCSMREAYNRLSKPMQEFLEGLDAVSVSYVLPC